MGYCTNCGQAMQPDAQFCTNCGTKSSNTASSDNQALGSNNHLKVFGGQLYFDSEALTFTRDTAQVGRDAPGFHGLVSKLQGSLIGNFASSQAIPLGLIDSVEISWVDAGLIAKVPLAGELMAAAAGGIRIYSASGGPRSEQGFSFVKGQEDNAIKFVNALKLACENRGRKVEMVSGSQSEAMKLCPDCAEEVKAAARVCRFCGYKFS